MRAATAALLLAMSGVVLAGCAGQRTAVPYRHASLKDDVPAPRDDAPAPKADVPAPAPKADDTAPAPKAAEAPAAKTEVSIEERARAEQWNRCGQRHVDYQAGRLNESADQKRLRDEICAELHRYDHVR
jgi:hypothetical protein